MAGFKQAPDYDFLKGVELTQIRVNKYTVDFVFTEGQGIAMATEFDHYDAAKKTTSRYDIEGSAKEFTVYSLLNLRTTDAVIVSDDELKLIFENGDALMLLRTDDGYESMTIWGHPGGTMVIE
jgi:hypothetical protein